MNISPSRKAFLAFALVATAACGSDSTGPADIGPEEALQSLARGLEGQAGTGLPFALSTSALGTAARGIDRINVTIAGAPYEMFALGLRVTYPTGTCIETLFIVTSVPALPGCTPPPLGLVLVLWQTRSGSRPPERLAFISADVGTANFSVFSSDATELTLLPAFAIYTNDRQEFWISSGGSLTSQVVATSETCSVTPPPFAKSSTCNLATFDEAGQIRFDRFDFTLFGPGTTPARESMDLVIPRQTVRGILQAITEVTPVTIPGDWDY